MTRKEKKGELIKLLCMGTITIGDLIDECFEFGQQQPRWISVEDELPKKDGKYLFYDEILGVQASIYYDGCALTNSITHWMPTPQPPKKGGEK